MKAVAEELIPPAPELNPYVQGVTDFAAQRCGEDPVFAAWVMTVVSVVAERRLFEGMPFDDYDEASARAVAAVALIMAKDLESATQERREESNE